MNEIERLIKVSNIVMTTIQEGDMPKATALGVLSLLQAALHSLHQNERIIAAQQEQAKKESWGWLRL